MMRLSILVAQYCLETFTTGPTFFAERRKLIQEIVFIYGLLHIIYLL